MEQTLPATRTAEVPAVYGASIFLDMQRFSDAQRVATLLASSTLIPDHFRGEVANCVIALNLADRLRVDPFMLMQNMYVVHGRPGIEGKLAIALIEGTGRFSPLKFRFEGKGTTEKGMERAGKCTAYATELATGEVIEGPPVTWEMAVAEGWTKAKGKDNPVPSKWQTMPDLMFRYRSAMFFARANCPGALLGLRSADEIEDIDSIPMQETATGTYQMEGNGDDGDSDAGQPMTPESLISVFDASIPKDADPAIVSAFLAKVAETNKKTLDEVKIAAASNPKELASLWNLFPSWSKQQKKQKESGSRTKEEKKTDGDEEAPGPCPNREDKAIMLKKFCDKCTERRGCPVWEEADKAA